MNEVICPSCAKPNLNNVDICQYCGTVLKRSSTEPLAPILPGDMPVESKTSDLESTLPGWLRNAHQASQEESDTPEISFPSGTPVIPANSAQPADPIKPESPRKKTPASPLDFLAGLSQVNDEDEETPDWMQGLQENIPAAQPEQPAQTGSDWGFGSGDQLFQFKDEPEPSQLADEESQADKSLGWLASLEAQDDPANATLVSKPPAAALPARDELPAMGDLPDWLSALTGGSSSQPDPAPSKPQPAGSEDAPDWLSGLGGDFIASDISPLSEPGPTPDAQAPDWLTRMSEPSGAHGTDAPAETDPGPDLPAWLGGRLSETAQPASEPQSPSVNSELFDWFNTAQDAPSAQAVLPETLAASAQEVPDWMRDLQAPASETPAMPVDDIPDWMTGLQDSVPLSASSEMPAAVQTPLEELPDWMRDLQPPSPVSAEPVAQSETPAVPVDGIPDWMLATTIAAAQPAPPTPPKPVSPPAGDLSFWLSEVTSKQPAASESEPARIFFDPQRTEQESAEETPTWLAGSGERLSTAASEPPQQAESVPSAQTGSGPLLLGSSDEQNIDSILAMETPDWLAGFTPSDAEKTAAKADERAEDLSLLPAELPSWVQAMRPMESVMADADDGQDEQLMENHGPLAGLRSVLPVQSGMADAYNSKPYALKLLADETQLAQAALLDNLLNSESTPQIAPSRAKLLSMRPLRWLIAVLLLLAVLIPAILKTQIFPVPSLPADASPAGAFISITTGLSSSQPVLVVVDYQPGFAGELEIASGPVIAQLEEKNVPLAFISTSPVGPFMIERLLKKYAGAYQLNKQYVNLGYLPGGAGGIKAFAEQPYSTVGHDTSLGNMWETPALAGATVNAATSLSNFGAVIVLTDNPDTGRLWIEQAQPSLKQAPMLMVVSAQAEPMIRPYMLSDQIKGLLAGLEGAAIYENQMGVAGGHGPRTYWDAFGMSMLAAELLILLGGAWGLITGLRARRTATEQDEA